MADNKRNYLESAPSSSEHVNTARIALEYTVKSGDTMLAILDRHQHRLEGGDYVWHFIRANQLLPNLRAWDKIQFQDHGTHYLILINGVPNKRSDGMPRRFFKSEDIRRTTEVYDQIRREEQQKNQRELEILAREHALQERYGLTPVRVSNGYRIEKNGAILNMDFRNLQATENAMRVISHIIKLYNQQFVHERPRFYADTGNLKVDNRRFFDTTYLKGYGGNFDVFLAPNQDRDREMRKLADFLNALFKIQP